MNLYLDAAGEILSALIGVALGLTVFGGVLWWQYREFQGWPHSRKSYWLFKLGAPVVFGLLLIVAGAIANLIEGLEALGVFFAGMFVALPAAPLLMAAAGPKMGIPFRDAIRPTVSIAVTALGVIYGGSMAFNAGAKLFYIDLDEKKKQAAYRQAEKNPLPAGDAVKLLDSQVLLMPDGKRLVNLVLGVEADWKVYRIEVRTPRPDGTARYTSGTRTCFEGNRLHVQTLIDKSESLDFRMRWEKEGFAGLIEYAPHLELPRYEFDRHFEVFMDQGEYAFPIRIPAGQIQLLINEQVTYYRTLLGPPERIPSAPPAVEDGRCSEDTFRFEGLEFVYLTIYSDELRQSMPYRLTPREVAPEFR